MSDVKESLLKAQTAIARKDYNAAITHFTKMIDGMKMDKSINPSLALLSRSTCYMEMKQWEAAIKDCKVVMTLENVQLPQEIVTGCYSTRTAAASRLATLHEKIGDKPAAETYKKMATELLKVEVHKNDKALELKEEGNKLFKAGKIKEAAAKWEEALKMNKINANVLSNLSMVYLKMNQLDRAEEMAERCTMVSPSWPKGWLRKGAVAMQQKAYTRAANAYQSGLQYSPDDPDLKKAFMEASKLAEGSGQSRQQSKADSQFDKKIIGMMMDLKHNSWPVADLFQHPKLPDATFMDLKIWDEKVAGRLSDLTIADFVYQTVRLIYPNFRKGSSPVGLNPYFKPSITETSWPSYTIPNAPIITAILFHRIFSTVFPQEGPWTIAWTHQASPPQPNEKHHPFYNIQISSLLPHLHAHHSYAVLVSRKARKIVDFLSLWAVEIGGDHAGEPNAEMDWWFKDLVLWKPGKSSDDDEDEEDGDTSRRQLQQPVFYTCDDEMKVFEYLEGYYAGMERLNKPPAPQPTQSPSPSAKTRVRFDTQEASADNEDHKLEEEQEDENENLEDTEPLIKEVQLPRTVSKKATKEMSVTSELLIGLAVFVCGMAYLIGAGLLPFNNQ